jgi:hypothetical protein
LPVLTLFSLSRADPDVSTPACAEAVIAEAGNLTPAEPFLLEDDSVSVLDSTSPSNEYDSAMLGDCQAHDRKPNLR